MAFHTDPPRNAALPSFDQRCEQCGRPHGHLLRCLPDGRWLSPEGAWMGADGTSAPWPDVVEYTQVRMSRSVIGLYASRSAAQLAKAGAEKPHRLCRRCHLVTGREEHQRVARTRALMRSALGDLFEGPYMA